MSDDVLAGFDKTQFTFDGKTRDVFRAGTGPAVIVIAEMPGITPKVVEFARRVEAVGCTVALPHLFGTPGRDPLEHGAPRAIPYVLSSMVPACISHDFHALATGRTSPVIEWLRALARSLHEECGGPGVGVVGMCFTGGFALAMMADAPVLAPVLSQPSLPFGIGAKRKRDLGLSDADLSRVKQKCAAEDLTVLGLRFSGDSFVPPERFARLREELGDNFVEVEIDSSEGNPHGNPKRAHSVLTEHLVDEPGHPTRDALDQVLDLFRTRLLG
ncbi:MAG TPA: dienelactone hydrolase family protein [Acidimicrobiales bacterium]|jgi:dienelactone hydrolase|nr:dienelactone hydrolase family protein [Acidimicrobiales bacterium]